MLDVSAWIWGLHGQIDLPKCFDPLGSRTIMQHLINEGFHSFLSTMANQYIHFYRKGHDLPFQDDVSLIWESLPEVRCRRLVEDVEMRYVRPIDWIDTNLVLLLGHALNTS